jgi:hypothetical protein
MLPKTALGHELLCAPEDLRRRRAPASAQQPEIVERIRE